MLAPKQLLARAALEGGLVQRLLADKAVPLKRVRDEALVGGDLEVMLQEGKVVRLELEDGVWLVHPNVPCEDANRARHLARLGSEGAAQSRVAQETEMLDHPSSTDAVRRALILQAWGVARYWSVLDGHAMEDLQRAVDFLCKQSWAKPNPVVDVDKAPLATTARHLIARYRLARAIDASLTTHTDDLLTVALALQARRRARRSGGGGLREPMRAEAGRTADAVWLLPSGQPLTPIVLTLQSRLLSFVLRQPGKAREYAEAAVEPLVGPTSARIVVDLCLDYGAIEVRGGGLFMCFF